MNKYTLRFKDKEVEKKYLQSSADSVQNATFKFCSTCYILYYIFSLSLQLYNFDQTKVITRIVSIVVLLLCNIMVRKWNCKVDIGLFILNLIISVLEWENDDSYDKYNYYLYGNNTMLIHTLLLFTQSFHYALITNFILLVMRLLITGLNTNIIYVQFMLAIFTSLGLVYVLYQSQRFQRKCFLLTLKDNSWEIMLPLILTKPFLMFSFDEEKFTYDLKMMNKLNFPFEDINTVHLFLKEAQYSNKSLQEYIYFQIVKNSYKSQSFVEELPITFKRKKIQILLSGCYLAQPNFFLVLQSEDPNIKMLQKKFQQQHTKYYEFFKSHIYQQSKFLRICLVQNQTRQITKLLISHKESLLFYNKRFIKPAFVNLTMILSRITTYFQNLNYQVKFKSNSPLEIITIKSCLLGFLYEIFKILDQYQEYSIKCYQFENKITLSIKGLQQLPTTRLYELCERCLIKEAIQLDQTYQFVFLSDPNISYYRNNLFSFPNPYD